MNPKLLILPQILAVISLGIACGMYFGFSVQMLPALQQVDASTYALIQQKLDISLSNSGFSLVFFAATIFPFISAGLAAWKSQRRTALYWLLVSLLHFIGVYWVTVITNMPLHQEMLEWNAATPPADWQSLRDSWASSNTIRTIAEMICFVAALGLLLMREQLAAPPKYVMRKLH